MGFYRSLRATSSSDWPRCFSGAHHYSSKQATFLTLPLAGSTPFVSCFNQRLVWSVAFSIFNAPSSNATDFHLPPVLGGPSCTFLLPLTRTELSFGASPPGFLCRPSSGPLPYCAFPVCLWRNSLLCICKASSFLLVPGLQPNSRTWQWERTLCTSEVFFVPVAISLAVPCLPTICCLSTHFACSIHVLLAHGYFHNHFTALTLLFWKPWLWSFFPFATIPACVVT